jgi:TPR repeat protein
MQNSYSALCRILAAGLFGLILGLGSNAVASETIDDYIAKADEAFDRSDVISAMNWYRKAAELGYAPAQSRLAYLLDKAEENEEAVRWYRMAAEQQYAEAEFGLAEMYNAGEGVERDYEQAVAWFTRAAEQGYMPAVHVLALAHEKGQMGLRINYDASVSWLRIGVEHRDPWSIKRLAKAYRNGELGLRYEPEQASALEDSLPIIGAGNDQSK